MTPQQTRSVWLVLPGVFLYHVKHDKSKDRLAWGMARDMADMSPVMKKVLKIEFVDENDGTKAGLLEKFKEELSSTGTISTSKSTAERMYALISSASKKTRN